MAFTETRIDKILGVGSGTGGRPAFGNPGARWIDTATGIESWDDGSAWHNFTSSGTSSTAVLGADVSLTNNTYVDILSLSLAAGTWLLAASICVLHTTGAAFFTGQLISGSTTYVSAQVTTSAANFSLQIPLTWIVTLGSTTTVKVQVAIAATGVSAAKAAATYNGVGNNASALTATKIA